MDKNNRYLMDFRTQYHLIKQFLCRNTWKLLYFSLNNHTKYLSKLTKNPSTCNPKILTKLSELWVWNSRSGKNVSDPNPGIKKTSVADPGCLSQIPDPDFYPSRIPDLGSRIQKQQQKRGVKKNLLYLYFEATNFTKLQIISFY